MIKLHKDCYDNFGNLFDEHVALNQLKCIICLRLIFIDTYTIQNFILLKKCVIRKVCVEKVTICVS